MSSELISVEESTMRAADAVNLRPQVVKRDERSRDSAAVVDIAMSVEKLSAYYGKFKAIEDVSLNFNKRNVTAIIGPSGCGKSTLLRCLNRMHEVIPNARAEGKVMMDGQDTYAPDMNAVMLRRKVGMVFQKPNPFPSMSIYANVPSGLTDSLWM